MSKMVNVGVEVESFTSLKNKNKPKNKTPPGPAPDFVLACCFLCANGTKSGAVKFWSTKNTLFGILELPMLHI